MGFQVFGNLVLGLGFRGALGFASHSAGPSAGLEVCCLSV